MNCGKAGSQRGCAKPNLNVTGCKRGTSASKMTTRSGATEHTCCVMSGQFNARLIQCCVMSGATAKKNPGEPYMMRTVWCLKLMIMGSTFGLPAFTDYEPTVWTCRAYWLWAHCRDLPRWLFMSPPTAWATPGHVPGVAAPSTDPHALGQTVLGDP